MKLILKRACVCEKCSARFNAPDLGDYCYGEFLLWSATGECRYLNAFEDETYKEVIGIVDLYKKFHVEDGFVQEVYGRVACDPDGNGFFFHISNPPCPQCGSTNIVSVGDQSMGEFAVKAVTHFLWNSLSYEDKIIRFGAVAQGLGT